MTEKKTFSLFIALAAVVIVAAAVVAAIGSASAYMKTETWEIENEMTPAKVSCSINETFEGNKKTGIKVTNTGNIDAYIRVCLVTYWVNNVDGSMIIMNEPSAELTVPFDDEKWLSGSGNVFYYTEPVSVGETVELFKEDGVLELKTSENGNLQVIDVFAEAIQYLPQGAAEGSWGVTINDASGIITAVN